MSGAAPIRTAAAWAVAGAALTLVIGAAFGTAEASELLLPLAISIAVTVALIALGSRWLAHASLRRRFVAISTFATVIALANLAALTSTMMVSSHDAGLVAILLVYALAVAVGSGIAVSAASRDAIERVAGAAERIAGGDLGARAGDSGAGGAELDALASTLDEMAAELERSRAREQLIEEQRRDLIVAVSHDLRTPLADLRAMAEAIEDRVVGDPDTLRAYASRMSGSVDSLSQLVDDLFEFVKLEAGVIETGHGLARVEEVVAQAVAACVGQAATKGLSLRTELGPAGGAQCSPRVTRVVQNLLANAIRHTPSDGTVVIRGSICDEEIELEVEDSGEGLPPGSEERVFEPFWRGDPARSPGGAGLGLALAKRIMESIGGTVEVGAARPDGAVFAVRIPGDGAAGARKLGEIPAA